MIDGQKDALQSVKRHRELSQGRYFAYNGTRKRVIGKKGQYGRRLLHEGFHATKGFRKCST